ncbi:MAG: 16S rRNA (uracil(1498)-N(3))-methyltransferase [Proteobacteria bacterium]|jgi:16S rRNA (uracil1498-N3)-methyltransferase|nr:16S rRNA (uracil(1498)-N(3))-methyltransferase [Pseudomonadota bacterium]
MRRYWLDPQLKTDLAVVIQGDPFHHIFDVCRQEQGSQFEVLFGDGEAHLVEVIEVKKKQALARILSSRKLPEIPRPYLKLFISLPRYPVMEALVEKCVELGCAEIQPFISDFSFVRKGDSIPPSKIERWNKIVISATQQSGRGELMPIHPVITLAEALEKLNHNSQAKGLFFYEGAGHKDLKTYLKHEDFSKSQELWVFVGSEGGFSSTEVEALSKMGVAPLSLGDQVLRVETACISILAVLKYELVN